jgi:peptidylprolyl isomerase
MTATVVRRARPGDIVQVLCEVRSSDDAAVAPAELGERVSFRVGAGEVFPCLEGAVLGMRPGDKKTLTSPAVDAFGPRYADRMIRMHQNRVPPDVPLRVGTNVQVLFPDGVRRPARIVEVNGPIVTLDANHPLAGREVTFEIELFSIA